jgi:signal transduction histidine kinase
MSAATPSSNITSKYSIPLLLVLIAAGLAGNYFNFPLFLNIDILFGSIFSLLALQFLGFGRGIMAAAIIASYTYFIWNEPYAIIIMTAEVAAVGWLMDSRKIGMVLADALYWLMVGMPLGYIFYRVFLDIHTSSTYIILTKQAVNGIANALVARLIFTAFALRSRSMLMSYKEIIYNLLAFFVLCPTLILLAISSRTDFNETDKHIRFSLIQASDRLNHNVETWLLNRKTAILNLAEMSANRSPEQMQPYLDLVKRLDTNFVRIGLRNREATSVAFSPLVDELGQSNIGQNFADRPFVPILQQTLKPMLSEVIMGKLGIPKPNVIMLAPVVINGKYGGFIGGTLNLKHIREELGNSSDENATFYTLIDKNSNVIMTNRSDQAVMTRFLRSKGTLNHLEKGISQWIPTLPPNTSISERWKQSYYVAESVIGDLAEWKLILEQPVAPFQKTLYDNYTGKLTLMFLILLGSLALAEFLSRRTVVTLGQLRTMTQDLPVRLLTDDKNIVWPESGIQETNHLINNFREMAVSLTTKFQEVQQTAEQMRTNFHRFQIILSSLYGGIVVISNDNRVDFVNQAFCDLFDLDELPDDLIGLSVTEVIQKINYVYAEPPSTFIRISEIVSNWQPVKDEEISIRGNRAYIRDFIPIVIEGKDYGRIWHYQDITKRKHVEEELIRAKIVAESAAEAKSRFLSTVAHEFRTPLSLLISGTDIICHYGDRLGKDKLAVQNERLNIAAQKLSSLVDSVLSFNRLESNTPLNLPALMNIEQTCRTIAEDVEAVWCHGQNFSVEIDRDCGSIMLDKVLFRQVLENLLTNAFRYTPADGSVLLRVNLQNSRLQITVSDTGIGIPEKDQERIFDAFCRGSNVYARSGLGLGLSIIKESLLQMNGTIQLSSKIGEGTKMLVEIPIVEKLTEE